MAPAQPPANASSSSAKGALTWRPTKIMNMRDLSKDDDFLSHLLVEKLGTGTVPLLVHKMDSSRRLPKTDAQDLLQIVRRLVVTKGPVQHVTRQAVDELLILPPIRYYLKPYTQKQINAFATHASRYFELYHPSGCIEIAHTSRYSHRTGKSELCILATRNLAPGTVITELKGSMANLSEEEDKELKRTDLRNSDIRRDFSVIHSKQMKKNHLFLGPARFVNHDCDNNCELFREGKYITFRVLRAIAIGEEITAHYGDGYFGRKNRHCLCETCEKKGRGGYAPDHTEDDVPSSDSSSDSNSDSDSDSDTTSSESDEDEEDDADDKLALNVNERRTRRGVYAIVRKEDESEESEEEGDLVLTELKDLPTDGEIELTAEVEAQSELTPLSSRSSPPPNARLMTPDPETAPLSRSSSALSSLSSTVDRATPKSGQSTPFRSIISTRRQRAQEAISTSTSEVKAVKQLVTPPLSEDTASLAEASSTPTKRITRSVSSLLLSATQKKGKEKGKGKTSTPLTPSQKVKGKGKEVTVKKEESESRVLRTRPSLLPNPAEEAKVVAPKPEIPRGPDGKPLPTCSTCSNILPVISVDSKVVWGLGFESSPKKKKKDKHDCPRCIRHFAIYGLPWPCRVPPHGTVFLPTPREEVTPVDASSRLTQKVLPMLDKKLAAAASASQKSRKHEKLKDERPTKRRKTEPSRVEMSAEAKKALLGSKVDGHSQGGRRSLPNTQDSDTRKRKRGRPRLPSVAKSPVKEEEVSLLEDELASDQPRDSHGRFGKKGDVPSPVGKSKLPAMPVNTALSRAQRAIDRGKVKTWLEQKAGEEGQDGCSTGTTPSRKRANERNGGLDESPRKKLHQDSHRTGEVVENSEPLKLPFQRFLPRNSGFSFRGGKLVSNPTPHNFARRPIWNPPQSDDESSGDETGPVTPDEDLSPIAVVVESGSTREVAVPPGLPALSSSFIPTALPSRGALTFKPSPFNFARRRWASMSASPPIEDECSVHTIDDQKSYGPFSQSRKLHGHTSLDLGDISDLESLAGSDRLSSISSLSSFSPKSGPSRWSRVDDLSSLSSETAVANELANGMTPIFDALASGHSADEHEDPVANRLQHIYPTLSVRKIDSIYLRKSTSFSADPMATPPNLINAGWDSCSDLSD